MNTKFRVALFGFAVALSTSVHALAQQVDPAPAGLCDELAAFPFDPQRRASGVAYAALNAPAAIAACSDMVRSYPSSGRLHFQLGRALERAGRVSDAIQSYQRAAQLGHPGGFNNLGELYRDGKGFPRDAQRAQQHFEIAAAQGYPEGQFNLAALIMRGGQASGNVERARALFAGAAAAGYPGAGRRLEALPPHSNAELERQRQLSAQAERRQGEVAEAQRLRQEAVAAEVEQQRQLAAEMERQRQLAIEMERQRQQAAAVESERRQREVAEAQRLRQEAVAAEVERQRQLAAEMERQRQLAIEMERQRQQAATVEMERRRQQAAVAEMERQRQRQQAAELERQRQLAAETERREREAAEAERRRQQAAEAERQRQLAGVARTQRQNEPLPPAPQQNPPPKDIQPGRSGTGALLPQEAGSVALAQRAVIELLTEIRETERERRRVETASSGGQSESIRRVLGVGLRHANEDVHQRGVRGVRLHLVVGEDGSFAANSPQELSAQIANRISLRGYSEIFSINSLSVHELSRGAPLDLLRNIENDEPVIIIHGSGFVLNASLLPSAIERSVLLSRIVNVSVGGQELGGQEFGWRSVAIAADDRAVAALIAALREEWMRQHNVWLAREAGIARLEASLPSGLTFRGQLACAGGLLVELKILERERANYRALFRIFPPNSPSSGQPFALAMNARVSINFRDGKFRLFFNNLIATELWPENNLSDGFVSGSPQFVEGSVAPSARAVMEHEAPDFIRRILPNCERFRLEEADDRPVWEQALSARRDLIDMAAQSLGLSDNVPNDGIVVRARESGGPNIIQRMDGGLAFRQNISSSCLFVAHGGGGSARQFHEWIASVIAQRTQTRGTGLLGCDISSQPWDMIAVNRRGLVDLSDTQLAWLASQGRQLRPVFEVAATEFYAELERARVEEERRRQARAAIEQERSIRRDENLRQVRSATPPRGFSLFSTEAIMFIVRQSGVREVCHFIESEGDAARRASFFQSIASDEAVAEAEPLLRAPGQLQRLTDAEQIFAQVQAGRCQIIMGAPSQLRPLVDAIGRISSGAPIVAGISFSNSEIQRRANDVRDRFAREEAEAQREERQRQRDDAGRARGRQQSGAVSATITCRTVNGREMPVYHCIIGRSTDSVGGRIIVTSGGQTTELNAISVRQRYGVASNINLELTSPWRLTIQAGHEAILVLRAEVVGVRGNRLSEEVGQYRVATLGE